MIGMYEEINKNINKFERAFMKNSAPGMWHSCLYVLLKNDKFNEEYLNKNVIIN